MGDPNASIPTPQPVQMRPMFGSFGGAVGGTSIAFVSQANPNPNPHPNPHPNPNPNLDRAVEALKA